MSIISPKILFVLRSAQYFHYFQSVVAALCERGRRIEVLFDRDWNRDVTLEPVEDFAKMYPEQFSFGWAVPRSRPVSRAMIGIRAARAWRRYLVIAGQSDFYITRWGEYLPKFLKYAAALPGFKRLLASGVTGRLLVWAEQRIAPDPAVTRHLETLKPAAVLVSPATMLMPSADTDYLKAALGLAIPTVVLSLSWDNLTTKGVLPEAPDVMLVWNELQREEAAFQHDVPRERIRIMGAPLFDVWFEEIRPSVSREEFCRHYGLRSEDPILLYLGSSKVGDESWIPLRIRGALDASSDPLLKRTQIIIRPHPGNAEIFDKITSPGIAIVPRGGALPRTEDAFRLFADTLAFSAASIGVTTSAFMESTIMGKPTVVLFGEEFAGPLGLTLHQRNFFRSGVIRPVASIYEALKALIPIVQGETWETFDSSRREFLSRFIRPCGIELPAGEAAVDAIEEMLSLGAVKRPLVSIGLAAYNGERVIRRAIDSLLGQTYRNIELVISDDCSTDTTYAIAREYADRDPRIRLLRLPRNGGYVNNFYAAFAAARGKYFMWAAQDDRWSPECIEKLVEGLETHPEHGVALSSFQRVYEDGPVQETVMLTGEYDFTHQGRYRIFRKLLMRKRYIAHFMYGLIRREFLARILERPLPEQKAWDVILVSEMAISTRFLSVYPVLRFSSNKCASGTNTPRDRLYTPPVAPKGAPWIKIPHFFVNTYTHGFVGSLVCVARSGAVPVPYKVGALLAAVTAAWAVRRKLWGSFLQDCRHFLKLCRHYEEFKRNSKASAGI